MLLNLVSQSVWLGIVVGVFFAGLGIGYAIFVNTYNPMTAMMNNPQMMNQWSNNPQFMQSMMSNPQFMQNMRGMMMNPQFQQNWMMNNTNWGGMMDSGMMQP